MAPRDGLRSQDELKKQQEEIAKLRQQLAAAQAKAQAKSGRSVPPAGRTKASEEDDGGSDFGSSDEEDEYVPVPKKPRFSKPGKQQIVDVTYDPNTATTIKNLIQNVVFPYYPFLCNEKEEVKAISLLLPHLSEYHLLGLVNLDPKALEKQAKKFQQVYSGVLTTKVNDCRNTFQQKLRAIIIWLIITYGTTVQAGKLLNVLQRKPEFLCFLPEEDEDGNPLDENKEANKVNEKYRTRLFIYADHLLSAVLPAATWGTLHRCNHTIQKRKVTVGNDQLPAITPGLEALVVLLLENAQEKWFFEAGLQRRLGRSLTQVDKKQRWHTTKVPPVKWSTKKAGSNKYGGWEKNGRLRFKKIRFLIEQGRALDTTEAIEEALRKQLEESHTAKPEAKKEVPTRQPKLDLRGAAVGAGGEEEEVSEEEYDSEEEDRVFELQQLVLAEAAKKKQEDDKKKEEEDKKRAAAEKKAAEAAKKAEAEAAAKKATTGAGKGSTANGKRKKSPRNTQQENEQQHEEE